MLPMGNLRTFLRDEAGATAIEYGLMLALLSLVILTAATTLGGGLTSNFNRIATKIGS